MRAILIAVATTMLVAPAAADPWKNESGKGREDYQGHQGNYYGGQHSGVPKGHRPPPGECRVWLPGVPAGQQPPPSSCRRAYAQADYHGGYVVRGKRDRRGNYGYYRCDEKDWRKGEC